MFFGQVNGQTSITATISHSGGLASGDYTIFSSNATTLAQVDKPFIVVEGFDIQNNESGLGQFIRLNTDVSLNFADALIAEGFDIIILNYSDAHTFVQRNAYLLVKLLELVNSQKIGSEQNIVGP